MVAALVSAAALSVGAPRALAQTGSGPGREIDRWQFGVGLFLAMPADEFADHVNTTPGVNVQLDRRLGPWPVSLGADVTYAKYGSSTRRVGLGELVPEIPDAVLEVKTDNTLVLVDGRVRIRRQRGLWRPYADGLFGLATFATRSSIPGVADCSFAGGTTVCIDSVAASATNARDVVGSYGGGAGIQFAFWSRPVWIDVAARYLRGGRARYLTEGDLRVEGAQAVLRFQESRTNLTGLYVGMAIGR